MKKKITNFNVIHGNTNFFGFKYYESRNIYLLGYFQ